jgi:hypothetical protein
MLKTAEAIAFNVGLKSGNLDFLARVSAHTGKGGPELEANLAMLKGSIEDNFNILELPLSLASEPNDRVVHIVRRHLIEVMRQGVSMFDLGCAVALHCNVLFAVEAGDKSGEPILALAETQIRNGMRMAPAKAAQAVNAYLTEATRRNPSPPRASSLADEIIFAVDDTYSSGAPAETRPPCIFIGHGHSRVWKDLRDFVRDDLGLEYEEFNRIPTAGMSVTDRLTQMLDKATFALLVLTGEDERDGDMQRHARANVIHEAGLFQGRLGFENAILLVEAGCASFSNVHGLNYIEFKKDDINDCFEDIRRVLKRAQALS